MSNTILQEIRLLTNFEIGSYNALTVLICGREVLAMQFGLSILESLANSITLTIHLEGLPKEESFAYIVGRVRHSKEPCFYVNASCFGNTIFFFGFSLYPGDIGAIIRTELIINILF